MRRTEGAIEIRKTIELEPTRIPSMRSIGAFLARPEPLLLIFTLLAFLLLGYHPYAEDGGIYTAAIAGRMDPSLFPSGHDWVAAHTRFALFVPLAGWSVGALHLGLEGGLMLLQATGLLLTLAAAWSLARAYFAERGSAVWAVALMAVCAGVPVAGTSLYLVDPYVTARTFTTPLLLWAVAACLRRRWLAAAGLCIAAALLHPLMGFWGALTICYLLAFSLRKGRWWALLLTSGLLAGGLLLTLSATPDSRLTHTLALTRGYWFLSQWRWYEIAGAIAPCMLLWVLEWATRRREPVNLLPAALSAVTVTALLFALCFARQSAASTLLARCQPLRSLHLVFAAFVVLVGGHLYPWLRKPALRVAAATGGSAIAVAMLLVQLAIYPTSRHLEMPWAAPANDWEAAFRWIRLSTPRNALFAVDANYIDLPGEDAQGFRAAALRSVLPDGVKDAGIASVVPSLGRDWQRGESASIHLDDEFDPVRRAKLIPLGVTWVVLEPAAATHFACPYKNRTVAVCEVR